MTEETTGLALNDANTTTETPVVDMTGAAPSKTHGAGRRLLTNAVSKKGPTVYTWAIANAQDSCPFATALCKEVCYGKWGQFPLHGARYRENYEIAQRPNFTDLMCAEIEALHAQRRGRDMAVALHEKGDFFSLPYLNAWRTIMKRTASLVGLRYFIYTRSWIHPGFRAALEGIAADCPHVRVNLSVDRENCERGAPARIGDGMLAYLTQCDDDVPVAPVDIVFRNLRQPKGEPKERIGGCVVCPHESGLYVARGGDDAPVLRKGAHVPVRCQECLLCISRDLGEWDAVKDTYRGTPGQPPVTPTAKLLDTPATIMAADPMTHAMDASQERNDGMDEPRDGMAVHPLLDLVPMMADREITELADDIRINGLLDDIAVYKGQIVDGRARWIACHRAGVTPRVREWDGDAVAHYVFSRNVTRRGLSASQRAMLVLALKPHLDKEAKKRMSLGGRGRTLIAENSQGMEGIPTLQFGPVRDQLAAQGRVNPRYVSDAARIEREKPELIPEILAGKLTIPRAYQQLDPPAAPQPSGTGTDDEDTGTVVPNVDAGGTGSETVVSADHKPGAATNVVVNGDGGPVLQGEGVGGSASDTSVTVHSTKPTTKTPVSGTSHRNKTGDNADPDDIKKTWGAFRRLAHRLAADGESDNAIPLMDMMRALAATTEKLASGLARHPLSAPKAHAVRAQAARLRGVLAITGKRPADAPLVDATRTPPVLPRQDEMFLRHIDKVAEVYTRVVAMLAKRMDWIVRVYGGQDKAEDAIVRMCEANVIPFQIGGMMAAWNMWSIKRQHRLATGDDSQLTDAQWSALTPLVEIENTDVRGKGLAACVTEIVNNNPSMAELAQFVADLVFDARTPAPPLEEDADCLGDGEEDTRALIAMAAAVAVENAS